ncbi:MAG: cytochrome c3 family protein [Desulfobacterales bacterium]|nr:cytochrome c3 family protein [Desulfobacterales bacterium]
MMDRMSSLQIWLAGALLAGVMLLANTASAQEEVASAIRRYKAYEASTGYYEEYEVLPRRQLPLVSVPGVRRGLFPYSPTAASVRNRSRLADSHLGIKFYERRRCEACHVEQTRDIHTVRANLTCRQCHGGEPVASINHYYSPLNPIRRHAYVCAKCHEGASASYASYIVHEPAAGSSLARTSFPVLYYAYWFMLILLVGTLAFFIPHSFLVGLRELLSKKRKAEK